MTNSSSGRQPQAWAERASPSEPGINASIKDRRRLSSNERPLVKLESSIPTARPKLHYDTSPSHPAVPRHQVLPAPPELPFQLQLVRTPYLGIATPPASTRVSTTTAQPQNQLCPTTASESPCLSPDTASARPSPTRSTSKRPSSPATTTATTASASPARPTVRPPSPPHHRPRGSPPCSPRRRRPQGQAHHQRPHQEVVRQGLLGQGRPPPLLLRVRLPHRPRPGRRPRDHRPQGRHL